MSLQGKRRRKGRGRQVKVEAEVKEKAFKESEYSTMLECGARKYRDTDYPERDLKEEGT